MTLLFSLIVLLAIVARITAQSVSLQVPIDGKAYPIRYNAHEVASTDAAKQFCVRNAAAFGITTNDALPNCVTPVAEYLKQQTKNEMEIYAAKNTIVVPVTISDIKFDVTFRTDQSSASDMAIRLCSEHAGALGVTKETLPACVGPVSKYLQTAVDEFVRQRTVAFRMKLEGLEFDISIRRDLMSAVDMGLKLCRENAKALNVDDSNFQNCVRVTGDFIQSKINEVTRAQQIKVPIKIGNLDTVLEIVPTLEEVEKVARKACSAESRAQTGIQEADVPACAQGVVGYVRKWYTEQLAASKK